MYKKQKRFTSQLVTCNLLTKLQQQLFECISSADIKHGTLNDPFFQSVLLRAGRRERELVVVVEV